MSQHRPGDEIADGVDARKIRLEALIDDDAAGALLKRHACLLQSQPRRERPAPHRDEDLVALEEEIFALALGIDDDLAALDRGPGDFRVDVNFESLLGERLV